MSSRSIFVFLRTKFLMMRAIPYINIHTHKSYSTKDIVAIVNISYVDKNCILDNDLKYSIGLHPWDIDKIKLSNFNEELASQAIKINAVAIGEIGLDKIIETNFVKQEDIFISQLNVARQLRKPVIIHCVRAFSDLIRIKKCNDTHTPWIIHGYQKNIEIAENLLQANCYLSFGKALLHNKRLQKVFQNIPEDKFFLETDDSDIKIEEIYSKAAMLRKRDIEEIKKQILKNYNTCFKNYE